MLGQSFTSLGSLDMSLDGLSFVAAAEDAPTQQEARRQDGEPTPEELVERFIDEFGEPPHSEDDHGNTILEFRERLWPFGQGEGDPHATVRMIAADLLVTVRAIWHSSGSIQIRRCMREKCRRCKVDSGHGWMVAMNPRRRYCCPRCKTAQEEEDEPEHDTESEGRAQHEPGKRGSMKVLPPLGGEDFVTATADRKKGLEAFLNTDLGDADAILPLARKLYDRYGHGRGGLEVPPTEDDLPVLQYAFELVRANAAGARLPQEEWHNLSGFMMTGQFCSRLVSHTGEAGETVIGAARERVWPDERAENIPHATALKIAADLVVTLWKIADSHGEFRIEPCAHEKCGRWVVAAHGRTKYCSDSCRKAVYFAGRKSPE
jgi:hypothetical protein